MFDRNFNQPYEPRWGTKDRPKKAFAILQTIKHFVPMPLSETTWLDIGCGNGEIAATIAGHVKSIVAIDPEPWHQWEMLLNDYKNLEFIKESVENLSLENDRFEIVVCNQVYEHVSDPHLLIKEIYRVLKPTGYCYFAGPNLLYPIEPHVFWPFVHWLPRSFAVYLMRVCGSKGVLDANSTDYWTLKRWLNRFEIVDVVPYIVKNPYMYSREGLIWQILSYVPTWFLQKFIWASPGFVFILRKSCQDV